MKSTFFNSLLLVILSFSLLSFSFKGNHANNEIKISSVSVDIKMLCKTWYIVSGKMVEGNEIEEMPEELLNSEFTFKKDFTFILKETETNEIQKGTWKEIEGDKIKVDIDDDPVTFSVVSLTENRLEISGMMDGTTKVEMVFSSISSK